LVIQQLPEASQEFSSARLGSRRIANSGSGSRVVSRPLNHSVADLFDINFGCNIFKVFVLVRS
jgi:hypothetical protein